MRSVLGRSGSQRRAAWAAILRSWAVWGPEWVVGVMAANRAVWLVKSTNTITWSNAFALGFAVTTASCLITAAIAPWRRITSVIPMLLAVITYGTYALVLLQQFGPDRVQGIAVDLMGIAALVAWTYADPAKRLETDEPATASRG